MSILYNRRQKWHSIIVHSVEKLLQRLVHEKYGLFASGFGCGFFHIIFVRIGVKINLGISCICFLYFFALSGKFGKRIFLGMTLHISYGD